MLSLKTSSFVNSIIVGGKVLARMTPFAASSRPSRPNSENLSLQHDSSQKFQSLQVMLLELLFLSGNFHTAALFDSIEASL
jgi:hypothetical protein